MGERRTTVIRIPLKGTEGGIPGYFYHFHHQSGQEDNEEALISGTSPCIVMDVDPHCHRWEIQGRAPLWDNGYWHMSGVKIQHRLNDK